MSEQKDVSNNIATQSPASKDWKKTQNASNQHLSQRYTKTKLLGKGTYGTVYKGIDNETGETVAIKIIDLDATEDDINDIMKEIIALRECDSKYVTQYFHSFNIGPELWIVMEYLGGGSVHDFLDTKLKVGIEETYIAVIVREVASGLNYLHSLKKIHRDIKAANILLNSHGDVKLADFGVVGQLSETMDKRMTLIGSPYWMAPEVIMQDAQHGYDQSADIWSLGVTAIEMAMGTPPYSNLPPYPAMLQITQQESPNVPEDKFSDEFRDFIRQCLIKDVKQRPRINEVLKHSFLVNAKKTSHLVTMIQSHQNANATTTAVHNEFQGLKTYGMDDEDDDDDDDEDEDEDDESDQFEQRSNFGSMVRDTIVAKSNNNKRVSSANKVRRVSSHHNNHEQSIEWTFGTRESGLVSPPQDVDLYGGGGANPYGVIGYTPQTEDEEHAAHDRSDDDDDDGDDDEFNGGTMYRAPTVRKDQLSVAISNNNINSHETVNAKNQQQVTPLSAQMHRDDSDTASFNGDTMVRNGHHTLDSPDDDAKQQQQQQQALPHKMPTLRPSTSTISYAIGVQTTGVETFDKSTQTQNNTVSDLVGVYKDMDDLFRTLQLHIDSTGQPHLQALKDRVKKLTHMKITERKLSKSQKDNDEFQVARDRIKQLRQRRADLKQKQEENAN